MQCWHFSWDEEIVGYLLLEQIATVNYIKGKMSEITNADRVYFTREREQNDSLIDAEIKDYSD